MDERKSPSCLAVEMQVGVESGLVAMIEKRTASWNPDIVK